jgi:hypothetical protein
MVELHILIYIGITLYLCINTYLLGYFRNEWRDHIFIKQIGIFIFCFFTLSVIILSIAIYNSIKNLLINLDDNYLQIRFWCLYIFTNKWKSDMDESKLKIIDRKCSDIKLSKSIWDKHYLYCANLIFKLNDFKPTYLSNSKEKEN